VKKLSNILETTKVYFEKLDDATIWSYIESGEPFGKAGGYGIQGQAGSFIRRIEGCYYSVWGFPLSAFCKRIREML
jgi:septum formation protein